MDKIGFGDQPYLVYRHLDAGHPHIHIVTKTLSIMGREYHSTTSEKISLPKQEKK
jgi:hypothetical protein